MASGEDAALLGKTLPLAETLGNECLRTGELTVLRASLGPEVSRCLTPGAGAIILAPIDYDGQTYGILGVRSADVQAFQDTDVETVRLMAHSASVAIRNAELVERLAASEEQYRQLHAQAADATLVSDNHGLLLDANEAAAALLWYSVEELRGMDARTLFRSDESEGLPVRIDGLHSHHESRAERTFRRKDGTELELEYSSRMLDDGRVHTTLRDITQRKRNEERLRSSLERLREIVQTQHEISALQLNPDAVCTTIIERAQRLTNADGASIKWFEGDQAVYRFGCGIAAPHVGLRLDPTTSLSGLVAKTGETVYSVDTETDARVDTVTARLVGARSMICAPLTVDGNVIGVLSLLGAEPNAFDELAVETTRLMAEFVSTLFRNARELETRQALVEQLQDSEARFRGAFDAASVGMTLAGLDGTFIQVNERFAQMLGYTVDELMALGVRGITHPDDLPTTWSTSTEMRRRHTRLATRARSATSARTARSCGRDLSVSLVRGHDGCAAHVVAHVQDITEQQARPTSSSSRCSSGRSCRS